MKRTYTARSFRNYDTMSMWIEVRRNNNIYHTSFPASEHLYGEVTSVHVRDNEYVVIKGTKGHEIKTVDGGPVELNGSVNPLHKARQLLNERNKR